MKTTRVLCALLSSLTFAACTALQQDATPGVIGASPTPDPTQALQTAGATEHTGGHVTSRGVRPKNCPGQFIYCVTVSPLQAAQLYFCYSPGSYCGPSQYQYGWTGGFTDRHGHSVKYFEYSFNPDPGDPTDNTISEEHPVKPTNGAYKYVEWVCPMQGRSCQTIAYVGIAVQ